MSTRGREATKKMMVQTFFGLPFQDQRDVMRQLIDIRAEQVAALERETGDPSPAGALAEYYVISPLGGDGMGLCIGDHQGRPFVSADAARRTIESLNAAGGWPSYNLQPLLLLKSGNAYFKRSPEKSDE